LGSRVIRADRLSHLEKCGAILRSGSGVDNVPVAEATRRNVLICNTPLAAAEEVSDHAIALLFAMVRQTAAQDAPGSARPPERIAAGGAHTSRVG
jgi:D-3-phosphoglycerate dehydrogenase